MPPAIPNDKTRRFFASRRVFQMFQEKTAFSVHEPVQVQADLRRIGAVDLARDLVDHEFPGQADDSPVQVASAAEVPGHIAHYHMDMQIVLALHGGDIAAAGSDLHIAGIIPFFIDKLFPVENAQGHFPDRADPGDGAQKDVFLFADLPDAVQDLLAPVHPDDDILPISDDGTIIRMAAADVNLYSRTAQGVRVMRVSEGTKVISLARVPQENEGETQEET